MGAAYSYTSAIGDWVIVGVWEQGLGGDNSLTVNVSGCGGFFSSVIQQDNSYLFEDRWSFRWKAFKVSTVNATCIQATAQIGNGRAPTLYGPVLYIIPSGTLSDNEVIDFALNGHDGHCLPYGSISNPAGHQFRPPLLSVAAIR
jgi:hypothetical protein